MKVAGRRTVSTERRRTLKSQRVEGFVPPVRAEPFKGGTVPIRLRLTEGEGTGTSAFGSRLAQAACRGHAWTGIQGDLGR